MTDDIDEGGTFTGAPCSACNGSGEGSYDGSLCSSCGGAGTAQAAQRRLEWLEGKELQ